MLLRCVASPVRRQQGGQRELAECTECGMHTWWLAFVVLEGIPKNFAVIVSTGVRAC